jgi:hypothetical protein
LSQDSEQQAIFSEQPGATIGRQSNSRKSTIFLVAPAIQRPIEVGQSSAPVQWMPWIWDMEEDENIFGIIKIRGDLLLISSVLIFLVHQRAMREP